MALSKFHTNLMGLQSNMLSFAMILTSNNSKDAYDLVQDTTLNALDHESEYAEGADFKNWIFTLMRNTFIANYKNAAATKLVVNTDFCNISVAQEVGLEFPEGCFTPDQVNEGIHSLSGECSEVFRLHITGYTAAEIADRLDISLSAVKKSIKMASKKVCVA